MGIIDTIRDETRKAAPKFPEGVIVGKNAVIAYVQRASSSQIIPCDYDPKQGVEEGKRCTYRWVPGRNKYVIESVFSTARSIQSGDQDKAAFELSPPSNLQSSDAVGGCILLIWDAPPQQNITFEVQVNTSASESGASLYRTRAGGILLPAAATTYFRVRSVTENWRYSAWTVWASEDPGSGGGGAGTDSSAIHVDQSGEIHGLTEETLPVASDEFVIEDASNSYAKRRVTWGSITEALEDIWDTFLSPSAPLKKNYIDGSNVYQLLLDITTLAAETALDQTNDYLVFHDDSASLNKKLSIGALFEAIQDMLSTFLVEGTGIDLSYNDTSNTLTVSISGVTSANISDFAEAVDDRIDALVTAGVAIKKTYDDGANTYTLDLDITELTEDTTPDLSTDFLVTYDTSASAHKKVKIANLGYGDFKKDGSVAMTGTLNMAAHPIQFDNVTAGTPPAGTYYLYVLTSTDSLLFAKSDGSFIILSDALLKDGTVAMTGDLDMGTSAFLVDDLSTPSNPATGKFKLYLKSDGNLYLLDDAGTETKLTRTDPNALHTNTAGEINGLTEKTTPVSNDLLIIEDSEDSNNKKKLKVGNLPGGSGTYALYVAGTSITIGAGNDQTVALDDVIEGQSGDFDLTTPTAIEVTAASAGDYLIQVFIQTDAASGADPGDFYLNMNSSGLTDFIGLAYNSVTSDAQASFMGFVTLADGDTLELVIENFQGSDDLFVRTVSVALLRI